ncbi:SagB/ThcOx family dehydrogenase [Lactobacillus sp. ESL0681]|uniref:SagB/ThcOx family dehydrogenase n=1 Tax=Lactobacillus sp. ESL0681 TaxID=2983211 RepID=UPI0023F858B3|nr:SagB/ThcOx family dehydrogenase [Lactobacillus sp. ESL0681]WEV40755.1 SagB/ThcOx family dehydrogenase [Lactobacillus sp. ESL0681]
MKDANDELKKIKKQLVFSEVLNNDKQNIGSHFNTHRYRQVIEGSIESPAFTYLSNIGHMNISDYKTIDYFNNEQTAAKEMAVGKYAEVNTDETIKLRLKRNSFKSTIQGLLNNRKSTRKYIPIKLSFEKFSELMSLVCDTKRTAKYGDLIVPTRGYASGGGLYPIDIYLLAVNVSKVDRGWYKLQPHSFSLKQISKINTIDKDIIGVDINLPEVAFALFYVFNFSKSYPKYGESSLNFALIETGEISELIDLGASDLSLGSCQVGGFNKNKIQRRLLLDGVTEQVVHSQVIGER